MVTGKRRQRDKDGSKQKPNKYYSIVFMIFIRIHQTVNHSSKKFTIKTPLIFILVLLSTMNIQSIRKWQNQREAIDYYEAGSWLHYIYPSLWNYRHPHFFFKKLGITPQYLKSCRNDFYCYCYNYLGLREDYQDRLTQNLQKLIITLKQALELRKKRRQENQVLRKRISPEYQLEGFKDGYMIQQQFDQLKYDLRQKQASFIPQYEKFEAERRSRQVQNEKMYNCLPFEELWPREEHSQWRSSTFENMQGAYQDFKKPKRGKNKKKKSQYAQMTWQQIIQLQKEREKRGQFSKKKARPVRTNFYLPQPYQLYYGVQDRYKKYAFSHQESSVPIQQSQAPTQQYQVPIQQAEEPIKQTERAVQEPKVSVQKFQLSAQQSQLPLQQTQVPVQKSQAHNQQSEMLDQQPGVSAQEPQVPVSQSAVCIQKPIQQMVEQSEMPVQECEKSLHEKQQNSDELSLSVEEQIILPLKTVERINEQKANVKEEIIEERRKMSILEIQAMMSQIQQEDLIKNTNPELIQQIQEMKGWNKNYEASNYEPQKHFEKARNINQDSNSKNFEFRTGAKYGQPPMQMAPAATVDIVMGKNQSFQTIMEKKKLKQKAAEVNYAEMKANEESSLDLIEKAKRDINFNLNRLAPQNLEDVAIELEKFAKQSQVLCKTLCQAIMKKAEEQPKYSGSYAQLCQIFCSIPELEFSFKANCKKYNSFKFFLVDIIQQSFENSQEKLPEFQEEAEKDKFLKETKKKMTGNVKFIAELIKCKVLLKKILKCVIDSLITDFMKEYYFNEAHSNAHSVYQLHFEVLIEFIEDIGQVFEEISDKKEKKKKTVPFETVEKTIRDLCSAKQLPGRIEGLSTLTTDQFFKVFKIMDSLILSKKQTRLSLLLKNLQERRQNGWRKHHVVADGPMKLKDLPKEEQEMQPEQKPKGDPQLDNKMQKAMKQYVEDDSQWRKVISDLQKHCKKGAVYASYLKFVGEDRKDNVTKRLLMFEEYFLEHKFSSREFIEGWKSAILELALISSDIPFCGASLAKILMMIEKKKGLIYSEYFLKFDEDEEEDQYYFMLDIYQKVYHYTERKEITELVEPKKKLCHLL